MTTVAAIQCVSDFAKLDVNRTKLESLVREAAGSGAKIIVAPEAMLTGYMREDGALTWRRSGWPALHRMNGLDPRGIAETIPGISTARFAKLAAELRVYLTVPLIEHDPATDSFFNSVVLKDPEGQTLLHYRKLHPWPYAETGWATPGNRGLQVVDTPLGKLGLLICYDINFEAANIRAAGVDILLYSIAWYDEPGSTWFQTGLPHVAAENKYAIIAANWSVSKEQRWCGYGQSLIADRTGKVVARVQKNTGDEIVYAEL